MIYSLSYILHKSTLYIPMSLYTGGDMPGGRQHHTDRRSGQPAWVRGPDQEGHPPTGARYRSRQGMHPSIYMHLISYFISRPLI